MNLPKTSALQYALAAIVTTFSTGTKQRPVLDEAAFEQLLAAAFVLQQHNDSLRASDPDADPMAVLSKLTVVDLNAAEKAKKPVPIRETPTPSLQEMLKEQEGSRCRVCGRQYGANEEFCGGCGLPRAARTHSEDLQGKWASLWYLSQAQEVSPQPPSSVTLPRKRELKPIGKIEMPEPVATPEPVIKGAAPPREAIELEPAKPKLETDKLQAPKVEPVKLDFKTLEPVRSESGKIESKKDDEPIGKAPDADNTNGTGKKSPVAEYDAHAVEEPTEPQLRIFESVDEESQATAVEQVHMPRQSRAVEKKAWEIPDSEHNPEFTQELWQRINEGDERESAEIESASADTSELPWYAGFEQNPSGKLRELWANLRSSRKRMTMTIAAGSFALLIAIWMMWPASPSQPQLSWFDSLLVELGMAQTPGQANAYSGNPDVRVWVDVHTALYYCPGSDLYGKTPGGHFSKQRTAQRDQYEPSTRVACN